MTQREPRHRARRHDARRGAGDAARSTASRSCRSSTTTASCKGLITVKDIQKRIQYPDATKDEQGRLRVGAAVGIGPDSFERAEALVDAGRRRAGRRHRARPLVAACSRSSRRIKERRDVEVIAGNVATGVGGRRRSSTRAPTPSRSASGPARSARPASSPASACRRSPRSTTAPRPPRGYGVPGDRRRRHPVLGRRREGDRRRAPTR